MICVCILCQEHPKTQLKAVLDKPEIEPAIPGLQGIATCLQDYQQTTKVVPA